LDVTLLFFAACLLVVFAFLLVSIHELISLW
jgi:hypothetical protein